MLIIRVPVLPISVSQVTVLHWYRAVGEAVGRNVVLVDLQINGDIMSLRCPRAGIVEKILVPVGRIAFVDATLAVIKDGLPVFDAEAEIEIEASYSLSADEFTISTQFELQQMLSEHASSYASRIQSLPPKWETVKGMEGGEADMEMGMEQHPMFEGKVWRQEEHRHPSDMTHEQLEAAELRYNPDHQPTPKFNPAPTPNLRRN